MIDGSAILSPDWKAVATNAVAFIAAVILLRRFAWARIIGFLEARTKRIQSSFEAIDRGMADLETREGDYSSRMASIEEDARLIRQREIEDGKRMADSIVDKARRTREQIHMDTRAEIEISKQMAEADMRKDMVEMSLTAAERLIRARLDDDWHRRFVEDAIRDLTEMKPID